MASRYNNARPFINNNELYEEFFEDRDVNYIEQYRTGMLTNPTVSQRARLETVKHVWKMGDRLFKLAAKHYGDPTMWWIIAWYNLKPTESHFKIGDLVYIPLPLDRVLSVLKRE
jgi:hypothetical protein